MAMCGIGAIFGVGPKKEQLISMLEKIRHRGKILFETEIGEDYALGTNRLPITDRENAVQPMKNKDGTILCVFNGEIYNYRELKNKLEEKGHKFKTDSDIEVLVHLYEEYEEKMLDVLDSEIYSFITYNKKTREYFAVRDEIGVKPLYWAKSNGTVYFASEMKQLTQFSEIKEIKMVPPGHYVKNGELNKYSNLIEKKELCKENKEKIAKKIRKLFHDAVKKRVQTDLPVGVFLSGGLDSTAVLSVARKYNRDITALIVGKKESVDLHYAKRYCEEFNIPYKTLEPPSEKELSKEIEKIIYITETFEPNVIRSSIISYYISKLGKDFRVILCGEGADETFAGYPEFEQVNSKEIKELEIEFLRDLNRTQCQRVDRTSMYFTEEVRVPFLDSKLVEYSLRIPGKYKVKHGIKKWILRKALEKDLPDYICWRRKVVLAEGAGYRGNDPNSGLFSEFIEEKMSNEEFERIKNDLLIRSPHHKVIGFKDQSKYVKCKISHEFKEWSIETKEEAYYFRIFRKFGFDRGKFAKKRPRACRIKSINNEVLELLKSKKYNRAEPYRLEELIGEKLEFVMFWGTLGKVIVDGEDIKSIVFLREFKEEIEKRTKEKVRIKIILADSHAKMNKMDRIKIYTYLQNIKEILEGSGFETIYLGILWKKWGLNLKKINDKSDKIENKKLEEILKNASKKYYKGENKKGHNKYYNMRKTEKRYLEKEFKNHIFLTYNNPLFREILPNMPTLYIYSKKGFSRPPWIP